MSNRVSSSVAEAVCEFNVGVLKTVESQQKFLKITCGPTTQKIASILIHRKKLFQVRKKSLKNQHARKLLMMAKRRREKLYKKSEGITYQAGKF